jgi:hypothetical protein
MRALALGAALTAAFTVAAAAQESDEARRIAEKMTEAHGGLERWAKAPSVAFSDSWTQPGAREAMVSNVIVEQGPRRAHLAYPKLPARIAWDGERCWSLDWQGGPPRFFALLNYYFLNLPWVVHDPGVILHEPERKQLWDDPTSYIAIRMTFAPGVGDTPDDYYVLYIHPDTHQLHGCTYVVTYPGLVPRGEAHTPEHVLLFEEWTTVSGLVVPTRFTIYQLDETIYAQCRIFNWSLTRPFDATLLEMPVGARSDDSLGR